MHGPAYAARMLENARGLAIALSDRGIPVFASDRGCTRSHAFAVDAGAYGGGHACAQRLRRANVLTSAIGLPHDETAGLRIGTNEIARWGATPADMQDLADLMSRALDGTPEHVAPAVTAWRQGFTDLHFVRV